MLRARSQDGLSIVEALCVVLVVGIAATLTIPKFAASRDNGSSRTAAAALDAAWEVAERYARGERPANTLFDGDGPDDIAGNADDEVLGSYQSFTAVTAEALDPKTDWRAVTDPAVDAAASPSPRTVKITRADLTALALCVAYTAQSGKLVVCVGQDGTAQASSRVFGAASTEAGALTRMCHPTVAEAVTSAGTGCSYTLS